MRNSTQKPLQKNFESGKYVGGSVSSSDKEFPKYKNR